jgi:hypothetical protein
MTDKTPFWMLNFCDMKIELQNLETEFERLKVIIDQKDANLNINYCDYLCDYRELMSELYHARLSFQLIETEIEHLNQVQGPKQKG